MKRSILTNKKGFELSINFVVMLIITLIVFGGCMAIAYKLLNSVNNIKTKMDKQTEDRLESMITSSNEEVIIAFNKKEVHAGEAAVFGLGITNINIGATKNFSVNITRSIKVFADGHTEEFDDLGWIYIKQSDIGEIRNNNHQIVSLVIVPPDNAAPGVTYVFDVKVTYKNNSDYVNYPLRNPIQKIRVVVI